MHMVNVQIIYRMYPWEKHIELCNIYTTNMLYVPIFFHGCHSNFWLYNKQIHWTYFYTYPGYLLKAEIIAVKGKLYSLSPSFQKWSPRRQGGWCLQLLPTEERTWFLAERRMLLNCPLKLLYLSMILCACAQQKTDPSWSRVWCFVIWILCPPLPLPHFIIWETNPNTRY